MKKTVLRTVLPVTGVLLMILAGVITYLVISKTQSKVTDNSSTEESRTGPRGGMGLTDGNFDTEMLQNAGNTYSVSSTTVIGTLEEDYTLDFLSDSLYVEEVYAESGTEVDSGMAVMKLSSDSIQQAREELTREASLADLNYKAGKIDYEQGLIDANETYQLSLLEQDSAQSVYDSAVERLDSNIEIIEENLADIQEKLGEYELALTDATYYWTYYELDELNTLYETYNKIYQNKLAYYGLGENQLNANGQGAQTTDEKYNMIALYLLKTEVAEKKKNYELAYSEYEAAVSNLQNNYLSAQNEYAEKECELEKLHLSYETSVIQAKSQYNSTIAKVNMAKSNYDAAVQKLEDTFQELEDAKEEAEKNLAEFESRVGDGYLYAETAGYVMAVNIKAGSYLSGNTVLLYYSNPGTVTVTVAVDQSEIAGMTIGDAVTVYVENSGTYEAEITKIETASQSTSKTDITYNVTVTLSGELTSISMNQTATVFFTTTGGEMDA